MLASLILGESLAAAPGRRCTVVVQRHSVGPRVRDLGAAVAQARPGDCVAYGIALDTPLLLRLLTVATMRFQLRSIERTIGRFGGQVLGRYGVDPSLDAPACFFELNSPAAAYAERCLRPRGAGIRLRRFLTRWFGCDPALGGIVVLGIKPCS